MPHARARAFILYLMKCSVDNASYSIFKQYQCLLLKQSNYPLLPIYNTKNLAKKISWDQEWTNKVNLVGPDKAIVILDQITIKIDVFGKLYRQVLEEVNELQDNLFGGIGFADEAWFLFKVPDLLVNLVNVGQPGYCFGDEARNDLKKYKYLGLRTLFNHPCLQDQYGCMVAHNKFVPNVITCHDFLQQASLAKSKLVIATHYSVGGLASGTEFTSQFLQNHPQGDIQNVKVIEGDRLG
jgi:hypothetical protein